MPSLPLFSTNDSMNMKTLNYTNNNNSNYIYIEDHTNIDKNESILQKEHADKYDPLKAVMKKMSRACFKNYKCFGENCSQIKHFIANLTNLKNFLYNHSIGVSLNILQFFINGFNKGIIEDFIEANRRKPDLDLLKKWRKNLNDIRNEYINSSEVRFYLENNNLYFIKVDDLDMKRYNSILSLYNMRKRRS